MARGQLPKAYLRIDPNIDHTHPDLDAFIRLLCAANRQPRRGWFRDMNVLDACLGKRAAARLLERGDVIGKEGALYVDGWDIWQEGDMTVGERMRRYRNKDRNNHRNGTVTEPSPNRIPTSEALRRLGVKASPSETERTDGRTDQASLGRANPFLGNGDRPRLESECLGLVRRMVELTGEEPTEVIARAAGYEGAKRTKVNPASMSDDRLILTVRDLRADVAAEERKRDAAKH